ncbi:MAG: hypothetical protein ACRCZF_06340, partial [Gemmataceae bacterium]
SLGCPSPARSSAAFAILTAFTLDGLSGNLPLLTGASGGRLLGRWTPGEPRNWAYLSTWMAEQLYDLLPVSRAA